MRAKIRASFFIGMMLWVVSVLYAASPDLGSLKFKDTEISTVLKAIEKKAAQEGKKVNVVATSEVYGLVTVDLENVDWKTALKVILKMYDLGYSQEGSVITVSTLSKIQEDQKKEDEALFSTGGMKIEAFKFRYVEAADAAKMIQPFLSKDGKASVMDVANKQGWGFSASTSGLINVGNTSSTGSGYSHSLAPQATTKMTRTKILVVSDTPSVVRQIAKLLEEVDIAPKQVLIRALLLEVNREKVRDLGLDFGTPTDTPGSDSIFGKKFTFGSGSRYPVVPDAFNPAEPMMTPSNSGLQMSLAKVEGTKFEVVLHALQEDVHTNTLSTPTILTLDNREATILVGQQFPIIETNSSTYTDNTVGGSLSFYQNIGIQLRVIPQICGENEDMVNLIVHPTVSDYTDTVDISGPVAGTVIAQYPIINTREAETEMMVQDGETVVLGGLLKDAKTAEKAGIPYLSDIPLLGKIFDRNTDNGEKTDLLIFLTVKIVRPSTVLPADVLNRTQIDQMAKGI